jgi:hypothetical protein
MPIVRYSTRSAPRIVDLERHFDEHRGFVRADVSTLPYGLPGLSEALDE